MASPILRWFDVQVHHHTAFRYWNMRGLIGERWGHGPHFSAWGDQGGQLMLSSRPGEEAEMVGVIGIKAMAFRWRLPPDRATAHKLATEWLEDCLTALEPRAVVRVVVRHYYNVRIDDPGRANEWLEREFGPLSLLGPQVGYDRMVTGTSYQHRGHRGGVDLVASGRLGIMNEDQAPEYFEALEPDYDSPWSVALLADYTLKSDSGIPNVKGIVREALKDAAREADEVLGRSLRKMPDA